MTSRGAVPLIGVQLRWRDAYDSPVSSGLQTSSLVRAMPRSAGVSAVVERSRLVIAQNPKSICPFLVTGKLAATSSKALLVSGAG